jgi:hypothetical protein
MFLPRPAMDHDSPDLWLLSSWVDRHGPPHLVNLVVIFVVLSTPTTFTLSYRAKN